MNGRKPEDVDSAVRLLLFVLMIRDEERAILNECGRGNQFDKRTALQRFLEVRKVRTQIEEALDRYWGWK